MTRLAALLLIAFLVWGPAPAHAQAIPPTARAGIERIRQRFDRPQPQPQTVIVVVPQAAPAAGSVRVDPQTGERVRYVPVPYPVAGAPAAPVVSLGGNRFGSAPLAPLTGADSAAVPPAAAGRVTPPTLGPGRVGRAQIRSDAAPRVVEVERALLETGLFRAVGVNFEFAESTLLDGAGELIDPVGEVLRRYPGIQLVVAGHTDSIGSFAFNQELSEARAQTVRQYLIDRWGVAPERLRAVGFGETDPLVTNANPTGRTLNRRVEFRVAETAR